MLIEQEGITLRRKIPLKVHFGEKGNVTFLKPEIFDGIIDYLEETRDLRRASKIRLIRAAGVSDPRRKELLGCVGRLSPLLGDGLGKYAKASVSRTCANLMYNRAMRMLPRAIPPVGPIS
jgi:hypothetical protein